MKLDDLAHGILHGNQVARVSTKQALFLVSLMQQDPTHIHSGNKDLTNDFELMRYPNGAGILRMRGVA